MIDFEILPHTADIKIRAYGHTKQELFRNALIGMFQVIHPIAPECKKENDRLVCPQLPEKHEVEITAHDQESLLVDFLSEALYLSDVYNQAYLDVIIHKYTDSFIKTTLCGVNIIGFEVVEIKAVTYHELTFKKSGDVWQVDVVFDI